MAKIVGALTCEMHGLSECKASMQSIGEAAQNAWLDLDIGIGEGGDLTFQGMSITAMEMSWEGFHAILRVRSAPAMVLFVGYLMATLPSRATVTWRDGWPFVYCPPNDERDCEDDPTPLVPNELVPA